MREIRELRGPLGLPVERDLRFVADKSISAYAKEARELRRIDASSPKTTSGASFEAPFFV